MFSSLVVRGLQVVDMFELSNDEVRVLRTLNPLIDTSLSNSS